MTHKEERIAASRPGAPTIDRPSSRRVSHEKFLLPDGPGLCTMIFGAYEVGIFQPLAGGLPECEVLLNSKSKKWGEPVRYRCQLSKGYLVPRTDAPISLLFTAKGVGDGSYVALTPADGPGGERWLIAGDSVELPLTKYPAPWFLEIYGENSSVTEVEVHSSVDEPLLYGAKLENIELIQRKLGS